jgi:heat shock protein HslJ
MPMSFKDSHNLAMQVMRISPLLGAALVGSLLLAACNGSSAPTSTPGATPASTSQASTRAATTVQVAATQEVASVPTGTNPPVGTAAATQPISTTPAISPPSLVGPVWQWQQTQLNNGSVTTVKDPSRYTLTFMANGSLAIKADCNQVTGTYQTTNAQLTITLGAATAAACPPDSQADTFVMQLANVGGYAFDGNALVLNLKLNSGGMRFVPLVNANLVGTAWSANSYNNGKGGFTTLLTGTQMTIQFGADGSVSGSSGCNRFTGMYQTSGTSLMFGPLATTRMACEQAIMDQEQAFLAALAATKSYRIVGTTLTLVDATDARMAEFTAP